MALNEDIRRAWTPVHCGSNEIEYQIRTWAHDYGLIPLEDYRYHIERDYFGIVREYLLFKDPNHAILAKLSAVS